MEIPEKKSLFRRLLRSKITIAIILVIAIIAGIILTRKSPIYQFVTVERGSITQSVSLTGNTTPAQSVSLAFGSSGVIARTYGGLGKEVRVGQLLAELNTSDNIAQLRQAQANVNAQQARLEGLQKGSRPEDIAAAQASVDAQQAVLDGLKIGARPEEIAASQSSVDKAKQDLENIYAGVIDTSNDSFTKANDAVRTQLDEFFTNDETANPKLTYFTTNSPGQSNAETQRLSISSTLNTWQTQLAINDQSKAGLETLVKNQLAYLSAVRELLNTISTTLDGAPSLGATTLASYKANVSVALNGINTATKNLNAISQSIASQIQTILQAQAQLDLKRAGASASDIAAQEAQVAQAQAQLDLKRAGTLSTDIAAQQAQVDQARASVASAAAKIQNAQIIAPITGIVTQFDAKIGQLASPSTPLVSIMSNAGYEMHSSVSETDVGKLVIGNVVNMTLDAFPGETFMGLVFYIAPSETNTQGVVSYEVKISFDKPDERLKSGLTANIDLQTLKKDDVLMLPQFAILQTDNGTFVETVENEKVVQHAVVLGIQDQSGNVEVVSGVTEGEQVLNIGRKTP